MFKATVFVYVISRVVCSASEEMEPVRSVQRRLDGDIYYYESGPVPHESCVDEKPTYLVKERQCVNNIEFINGNKNLISYK
jgi:hypothetical protein